MSVPPALNLRFDSISGNTPYLSASEDRIQAWRTRLGEKRAFRVGIAWSGNLTHKQGRNRPIALRQLRPLLAVDAEFISLQKAIPEQDAKELADIARLRDCGAELEDFSDTAALVSLLDLVISVDTAVAHLAGAMGKPAWILLPYAADWRWFTDREDSPWYPSVRLFRQPKRGDWESVVARAKGDLVKINLTP
jgi:hypothetical protein